MKNLLVTGGCGFIGSNFINYYFHENEDANIINLDAMYYCASENNVKEEIRTSDRYCLVKGNLCSMDLMRHILKSHKIDSVIHLPRNLTFKILLMIHCNIQAITFWGHTLF